MDAKLRLDTTPTIPDPPPDRGKLMSADEVANEIFRGMVSSAWVRRNVPDKMTIGHSRVAWFEYDVHAWLERRKDPKP